MKVDLKVTDKDYQTLGLPVEPVEQEPPFCNRQLLKSRAKLMDNRAPLDFNKQDPELVSWHSPKDWKVL